MKNNNVFIFLLVTFSFVLASDLLDLSSVYAAESSFTPFGSTLAAVTIPSGTSVPGCEETNSCYLPSEVTIDVGSQVTWSNDDTAAHTVTSGSATDGPDGIFDSGLFTANTKFSYTFEESGDYNYFCMVHPWMMGIIVVQGDEIRNDRSIQIEKVSFSDTALKQGDTFTVTIVINNPFSVLVPVEIRFDVGNAGVNITPKPGIIELEPGQNEFKYKFDISQNSTLGNHIINIGLWNEVDIPDYYDIPIGLIHEVDEQITIEEYVQVPQPPLKLEAKAISSSEIELSWQKPRDNESSVITGYKIEYAIRNSDSFDILESNTDTTSTTYQHTNLEPDTKYTYRISAINFAGISDPSDKASATTFEEIMPIIIRLETDKSNYEFTKQNNIVVRVEGTITNHKENSTVTIVLTKLNDSRLTSLEHTISLQDDGEFEDKFHLPKTFTTGSYLIEAIYENQNKTTEFGIIQNLGSSPNLNVPDDIVRTANNSKGTYLDLSVVTAEDKEDGSLTPNCEPHLGWFRIGVHTVNCTVTDSDGNSDEDRFKITVNNALPISEIVLSSSGTSYETGEPIFFSAKGSYDPDGGSIKHYNWNFGDDSNSVSTTDPVISHTYENDGTYTIYVQVTDDENSISKKSNPVNVSVSANYIWIIVIVIIILGGVGAFVAKSAFKSKPGDRSSHPDTNTDDNPKDDDDGKDKRKQRQPSIDMDIEFGSGIEKK